MIMEDFMNYMKTIDYGWIDSSDNRHMGLGNINLFVKEYHLLSPSELEKVKIGVCFDQVEYSRVFFEKNKIDFKTYFINYHTDTVDAAHSFIIYKEDNKYCWFESAYEPTKGIHKYNTLNECFLNVKEAFVYENKKRMEEYDPSLINIYEYSKPMYGIGCEEYFIYCTSSSKVINYNDIR